MSNIQKRIEERAYQFFLDRGCVHGYETEDWLRAEKEVNSGLTSTKKSTAKKAEEIKTAPKKPAAKKVAAKK